MRSVILKDASHANKSTLFRLKARRRSTETQRRNAFGFDPDPSSQAEDELLYHIFPLIVWLSLPFYQYTVNNALFSIKKLLKNRTSIFFNMTQPPPLKLGSISFSGWYCHHLCSCPSHS